jgi:tetratricopeptide (TPR) repeat protein
LAEADALIDLAELSYSTMNRTTGDEQVAQAGAIWRDTPASPQLAARLQKRSQQLVERNNCAPAVALLRAAISISDQTVGPENVQTIAMLTELVRLDTLRRDEAALSQNVPRLAESWLKAGEPADDIASPIYRKAISMYDRQGQYTLAEPLALRNLKNGEAKPGITPQALSLRVYDLASLYYGQMRYDEAEALVRRGAALRGKETSRIDPKSEYGLQKQIEGEMRILFMSGDATGALANGEAELARLDKQVIEDKQAVEQAVAARTTPPGASPPSGAQKAALERAVTLARARQRQHEGYQTSMQVRVADLHHHLRHYEQAESLYLQALAAYANVKDVTVAVVQSSLATLYRARGDDTRAEPLQRQALDVMLVYLGNEHPDVIDSARELTLIYQRQHKTAEAAALAERVSAIRSR